MALSTVTISGLAITSSRGLMVEPFDATIEAGTTLAIIGESGSGKTLTAKSLVGLLPRGFGAQGTVTVANAQLPIGGPESAWSAHRGSRVALMLQDPFTSLSPTHRCGEQIAITVEAARGSRLPRKEKASVVSAALAEVGLPARVANAYPHQLSGGMRQRVAIAAALAANPALLIADEPTTALDASNQAQILDLLRSIQRDRGLAVILISHDLGLVRGRTDEVLVMRQGQVVERGATASVLTDPQHEYTKALIEADPVVQAQRHVEHRAVVARESTLLEVQGLSKSFGNHKVLDSVSATIAAGEILGVVGESGSGKSTFARCIAGLEREDQGSITLGGKALAPGRDSRVPSDVQVVFQDPYSSLNPRMTIGAILAEALAVAARPASDVPRLLEMVDLPADFAAKKPSQLSGGQRQRVAIARALAPKPSLLICDESVSALDVSVQAAILGLLAHVRDTLDVSIMFISHDLAVVRMIADTVMVLKDGEVVESGPCVSVLHKPQHQYTKLLVAAARRENQESL